MTENLRVRTWTDPSWTATDIALLDELERDEKFLPVDAPRALLSVRLSEVTANTTSPARQELDLRLLARERGYRVVGVARDLNVSAATVPPWRRPQLGPWLRDRAPEFDLLLFWQLDRLVRRAADLTTMIDWCLRFGKNLVSRHDPIDLATEAGRTLAAVLGSIAEIEAANTGMRRASLWNYAKTQTAWLVGKPAYGYTVAEDADGRSALAIDEKARRALHWCRARVLQGASVRRLAKVLVRAGVCGPGLTASTLLRRLRNPALMGYRVEEDKKGGVRRSKLLLGREGHPIRIAEAIFTEEQFQELQTTLDQRSKAQPARRPGGATAFLGVLVCADCGTHMTAQRTRSNTGRCYEYLRCRACRGGGQGAPDPHSVYARLMTDVLSILGDEPVRIREYARNRWVETSTGKTFRQSWAEGGMEAMASDLVRAGITCKVTRSKIPKVRAPRIRMELVIPDDARQRLVVVRDEFAAGL
ncbi:recombinase family protein [Streptomyces sp. NPDC097981]|uniref:recombinase family protein n=1 Tax=Streptomyces sp. NPDC097981 TaxID=3155428 RepID=UPI003330264D